MIDRICGFIHNYFTADRDKHRGTYTILNGLELDFLQPGQYFRIIGSVRNDGVYQYPEIDLLPETFTGEIWAMKVPREVVNIAAEVEAWLEKYGDAMNSPFQSESVIGVYSYTKASASGGDKNATNGTPTWQSTFGARLNQYRKLS